MVVGSTAASVVARGELFGLLSGEASRGVTLISAPAGSGKTVLLSSWIEDAGIRDRVAWVSVEREERDAQHFWVSVVGELRKAGGGVVESLEPAPRFDGDAAIRRLINGLELLGQLVVLVIDDLHELRSEDALRHLELLLAGRPPLLRVILASRRDPRLGLHRLRLADELTEIRSADLRFNLEEARALLVAAGITLPEDSLALLHERTEGWVAGLRLAALALAGHPDPERFVAEFSGSERTVADYLFAEVLERQSEEARRLLLRTSIVDRVNAALADALTGAVGSRPVLQELEQQNAFVFSLDASRSWFRYHHLFADMLRLELERAEPELIPQLHRTAATWHAEHGYLVEAVRHAQAAGDWDAAARLVAEHSTTLALDGRGTTLEALLAQFPASAPSADPELALVFARRELLGGSLGDGEAYIALAESNASTVADERRSRFEISCAFARLMLARRRGDFTAALEEAQPLLDSESEIASEPGPGSDVRAAALIQLGIVELWSSQYVDAERHLEHGLELARRGRRPYLEVQCLAHLAVAAARRSFGQARERALEALAIAEAHGWESDAVTGTALVTLGNIDVWQGRFEDAELWLERGEAAVRPDLEPATGLLLYNARGRLFVARGQLQEAVDSFRAAARLEALLVAPQFLRSPTHRILAQTQMRLEDPAAARATLAALAEETPGSDTAQLALANVAFADGDAQAVVDTLAPVLDGSLPSGPMLLVEAFLLDAAARDVLGETHAAVEDVERALELAEQDRLIWPFVVTPPPDLLERHPRHRTSHGGLLKDILDVVAGSSPPPRATETAPLQEDLSESELRVLRYLPSNLSASEIASELILSVYTVKTHTRHIYAKLGVHRRTEAVERARELGILGSSSRLR